MVSTVFFSDFLEICDKKSEVHPKQTKWKDGHITKSSKHKKCCDIGLWSSRICLLDAKHFIQKTDQINQQKAPESLVW